jgi:polyhydroxyalkanoate synthesis regulator phasin
VAEVREAITKGVIRPLNLVMITRDRMEEVLNDAVERGRMTADDAQAIVSDLVQRGRQQTESVLGDLESLLNRGRGEVETRTTKARKGVTGAVGRATKAAREAADPALAQADRARRTAGVGPSFPILGYDDLTAAQVQSRLDGLSAAELRKVRDYEKRNANRKSVLDAVETKLNK